MSDQTKPWQWQEGEYTVTRSTFWSGPGCHNGCGILYYTKDNELVKVEGDRDNPFSQGRLCMRCLNQVEVAHHPDRLKWPLKRVGERGENKWERITWDAAYDIIVEKVRGIQQEYGPESIVTMLGTGRNACWQAPLLSYAGFGSPNLALGFLSGDSCMLPRVSLCYLMMGSVAIADMSQGRPTRYEEDPEWKRPDVIMIWGNNPIYSNSDAFLGHWIVEAMKRGSKLIVVDPKLTWMASRADHWLRLRPGTDAALAMGMMNVIINEGLYDKAFVEKWTYGFDALKEAVQEYTPEKVAEICWISKEDLIDAARFFAKANPGSLQWGLAVDQSRIGIPAAQALNCLVAICGFIDVPGGNILIDQAYNLDMAYNRGYREHLSEEMRAKRIGDDIAPMHKFGFASSAFGDAILKAMETKKPYPIKMLWMQSTNPIANMAAEAPRVYDAIKSLDFNVVVDLFMTPTAVACADLVLPCATSSERNSVRTWYIPMRPLTKVAQYAECKSDEQIILELGKRLNPKAWPWETDVQMLDRFLDEYPTHLDFKDLQKKVFDYQPAFQYRKYEKGLLRPDGQPGFMTPTGRIELFMTMCNSWGDPALPYYEEPPESPYSTPELYQQYPLVLTTGARNPGFFHSEHRQVKTMREFAPEPLVRMHAETAARYGLQEGDWAWIENHRGRCKQKVQFDNTFDPRVIAAEHGWWFPEKEGAEPSLFGVFDSNINNLTSQMQFGATGYGAPYKCLLCKIYKVTEENSKVMPSEQVTKLGGFKYERAN